ncbi:type II toxin-antitoxin system death-on-curing family toxin [Sinirhodobacter sp. WL0062]|uniref:Type II toxin-antitoxin system death-on-curing family toxin n=1 Tax=Rhodobacter flavimaris TaxID=2907145 RepID=A0ABS8YTL4_9RHOB|nr:type II toxin-antitoxin system death-on-curing family toxin [Sinirhodobacter sp. WL0062]MCE5973018.1 type II toxin-antitoxin system death-on-curing family toxin [Sinirhodobacter sp. WL0062]
MNDNIEIQKFSETLLPEVSYLYYRAAHEVKEFDEGLPAGGISAKEVLRAHFCVVDYFLREGEGEGVGGFGPKNIGLLLSAVARPHTEFSGEAKWKTVPEKAATLLYGLIMNHPFHDANKRTAYLSTVHYLVTSGYHITATANELEDLTVLVAEKSLSKFPRYRELRKTSSDPEIEYLAWYLRKNTHLIDRTQYLVTYRELEKILKRYNVMMLNPDNGSIDIMRWEDVEAPRRTLFSPRKKTPELRKVCSLGFPGWSKVVGKGRVRHLREQLGLMPSDGVVSKAFFQDVDDMRVLIGIYEDALRRLAYR